MKKLKGILQLASAAVALLVAAAVPQTAQAQKYPDKPIRLVLPFGAGGVGDLTARIVAEKLGDKLGQRILVENVPGAGGIAAARAVTSAPADGYTLALFSNGTAISVPLFKALPFDPVADFVPVSSMGDFDFIFAAAADSPYKTMADFVKAAKEKPGALKVGTINIGSTQNLSAQLLKSTAGLDFTIVPFKGSPDVLLALQRGEIQLAVENYSALKSQLEAKTMIALASSGPTRTVVMPNVPTVKEAGGGNFEARSWNAIFAPKGTPAEVIKTLNTAMRESLEDAGLKKRALDLGIEARGSTPEEIQQRLKDDIVKWGKVIDQAGIEKQ